MCFLEMLQSRQATDRLRHLLLRDPQPVGHSKQIRHWWLIRMLYWPFRSPFKASTRLPAEASKVSELDSGFRAIKLEPGSAIKSRERIPISVCSTILGTMPPAH